MRSSSHHEADRLCSGCSSKNGQLVLASRAAAEEQVACVEGACRCLGLSSRQDAARCRVRRHSSLIGGCLTARRRVRRATVRNRVVTGACRSSNGSSLQAVFGEVRRCSSSLLASLHQSDSSVSCKRKLVVVSSVPVATSRSQKYVAASRAA